MKGGRGGEGEEGEGRRCHYHSGLTRSVVSKGMFSIMNNFC